jgi:hypothetical protein
MTCACHCSAYTGFACQCSAYTGFAYVLSSVPSVMLFGALVVSMRESKISLVSNGSQKIMENFKLESQRH